MHKHVTRTSFIFTSFILKGLVFCAFVLSGGAKAEELVTDLSTSEVAIEANFSGEKILLFGAFDNTRKDNKYDVAIILRGPDQPVTVRRKSRIGGIWVNSHALKIDSVPAYYAISGSRPIAEIASPEELRRHGASLEHLPTSLRDDTAQPANREFIDGLIRNKMAQGLYQQNPNGVKIIGNRLFRSEIALPPGVPIGMYRADILLFSDGKIVSRQSNAIRVGIVGFEQFLHRWAHQLPILYGMTGVIVALISGWGAAIFFRRRI